MTISKASIDQLRIKDLYADIPITTYMTHVLNLHSDLSQTRFVHKTL